jgi:hypothetical protein
VPVLGLIITHIFWGDSKNVDGRPISIVELTDNLCNVNPLHKRSKKDVGNDKVLGGELARVGGLSGRPRGHVPTVKGCAFFYTVATTIGAQERT